MANFEVWPLEFSGESTRETPASEQISAYLKSQLKDPNRLVTAGQVTQNMEGLWNDNWQEKNLNNSRNTCLRATLHSINPMQWDASLLYIKINMSLLLLSFILSFQWVLDDLLL